MPNPVFTRPEAFQRPGQYPQAQAYGGYQQYQQPGTGYQQPGYGYQQPGYQQPGQFQPGYPAPGQGQPLQTQGTMTIDDVITKSAITMGTLFLAAAATFVLLPVSLLTPTLLVTAIVGFVTVLLVSMRSRVSPGAVLAYAVVEGLFIGAFSKLFEFLYSGIVVQAILGTFVAAGVTLAAYRYFRIRVTEKFRRIVGIATMGVAAMFLVNLVLSLFGVSTGLVAIGPSAGPLAWIVSLVCVVLAVVNLITDFDYIERGIAVGAPSSESWRAAFGLTVTMVWLYTEILRILSYFRNN